MVQTCQVFKWSGFQMPFEFWTFSPVFEWCHCTIATSYIVTIECYSTSYLKTRLKCPVFECLDHLNTGHLFGCSVFGWLLYYQFCSFLYNNFRTATFLYWFGLMPRLYNHISSFFVQHHFKIGLDCCQDNR